MNCQVEHLTVRLDLRNKELSEDRRAAQAEGQDRIGLEITNLLIRYSRKNGYVVVLDTSAANAAVVYSSSSINITQDIIRTYDQTYPAEVSILTGKSMIAPPKATTPSPAKP